MTVKEMQTKLSEVGIVVSDRTIRRCVESLESTVQRTGKNHCIDCTQEQFEMIQKKLLQNKMNMGNNTGVAQVTVQMLKENNDNLRNEMKSLIADAVRQGIAEGLKAVIPMIQKPALTDNVEYYTIIGYCRNHKINLSQGESIIMSKKCKKLSQDKGIEVLPINDSKWGKLNTYHISILDEVFEQ